MLRCETTTPVHLISIYIAKIHKKCIQHCHKNNEAVDSNK